MPELIFEIARLIINILGICDIEVIHIKSGFSISLTWAYTVTDLLDSYDYFKFAKRIIDLVKEPGLHQHWVNIRIEKRAEDIILFYDKLQHLYNNVELHENWKRIMVEKKLEEIKEAREVSLLLFVWDVFFFAVGYSLANIIYKIQ